VPTCLAGLLAIRQIGELREMTRRGGEFEPAGNHRFGERPAHATGTAGDHQTFDMGIAFI
jgi:hypothetical protein